ncbi:flavodoxin domain-containing protein [Mycolicibacterium nivoides]|uniref:Flavodoxin domain-containing protein n=1 Tax=Mycolicibacterium nivoides TaxID=2487344 RepID=A0ABW9LCW4_9MYCO
MTKILGSAIGQPVAVDDFFPFRGPARVRHAATVTAHKILVVYASEAGSTRQIAEFIAALLADIGFSVDVRSIVTEPDPDEYAAVVIGSAIHQRAWLPAAVHYAYRHLRHLTNKPVWMFSVGLGPALRGPVGRWLGARVPRSIATVRDVVSPRDYREFAGVWDRAQTSVISRVVYRAMGGPGYGDLRDWSTIASWAKDIADQLKAQFSSL